MISWDRMRDRYIENFLSLVEAGAAGTTDAPFYLLHFSLSDAVSHAYATFGASAGPFRHELAIVSVGAFPPFGAALEALAGATTALSPLATVACEIPGTPFVALLVLPPKDGTFTLGKVQGEPRYVLRLAPLTRGERALAEQEPERLLQMLRAAHALVADPYRDCVVEPVARSRPVRPEIAALRRKARDAIVSVGEGLARRVAAEPPSLGLLRSDVARIPFGNSVALIDDVSATIERAVRPIARLLPAREVFLFAEFIYVTFATHPEAAHLLDRALDPRMRLSAAGTDRAEAAAILKVTDDLAAAIACRHPRESEAALRERGQRAVDAALASFDPGDEVPLENHIWAELVWAMYEGVQDLAGERSVYMVRAFRITARQEVVLELDPDPRPPLPRLRDIAARIATSLFTAYMAGIGPSVLR